MKTIQNAGLMAILGCLLLGLTGCPPENLNPFDPEIRDKILVSGAIEASDVSFYINERGETDIKKSFMNGNGVMNGNNLIFANGSMNITGRHTHNTYREELDNVQFESGYFQYVFDNGDMISGYYSGYGIFCPENVCCDLNFQITGGTGAFASAMGSLTAAVSKNGSVDSPGLLLDLTGSIFVPVENGKK
ncbi:MAG: hypothetical protein KFF73_12495 [Cyclobacteriaceae bacterium]|nr:hypothetical protein [Cyclobacteriaceae bacterium]